MALATNANWIQLWAGKDWGRAGSVGGKMMAGEGIQSGHGMGTLVRKGIIGKVLGVWPRPICLPFLFVPLVSKHS